MDTENTHDEYMGYVSYVNLDNDDKFFNLIKSEMTEVSTNKVNYTLKKQNLLEFDGNSIKD